MKWVIPPRMALKLAVTDSAGNRIISSAKATEELIINSKNTIKHCLQKL